MLEIKGRRLDPVTRYMMGDMPTISPVNRFKRVFMKLGTS